MTAPEDRAPGELELIASMRELVLRLEKRLESGPVDSEAVTIAKQLHDLRGPLAATELRWETVASARQSAREQQALISYAQGYADGLADHLKAPEDRKVIAFPVRPAISA